MPKNKTVIILDSSRSFGNTRKVVDEMLSINPTIDLLDLNDFKFSYYDYEFKNTTDDFYELIQSVLKYDTIVFATPIYWYTMSAQLKTFFDRLSDLLHNEKKHVGRQLRGKNMAVLSCGSDDELFDGFEMPFIESANYLGMNYKGHVHTWIENDKDVSGKIKSDLKLLSEKLNA